MMRFAVLFLFAATMTSFAQEAKKPETDAERFAKWEKNIVAIEKRLKDKPAPENPVVFAGSSSMVRWDVAKSFPGKPVVNVGFGGSQIRDCVQFVSRIVTPLKPSTIVFYCGDNDLGSKRTPEQVLGDFQAYVTAVHKESPKTRILFVSVKPSLSRWAQFETQKKANAMVKEFVSTEPKLGYIDIVPTMLGSDGKPKPEYFVKDGLHLSDAGYAAWVVEVNKALGW